MSTITEVIKVSGIDQTFQKLDKTEWLINGQPRTLDLWFSVVSYDGGYHGIDTYYKTHFYIGSDRHNKKKRKKYVFWGPEVYVPEPIATFTIAYDVRRNDKTQSEVRADILKKIEIYFREQEIKEGRIAGD